MVILLRIFRARIPLFFFSVWLLQSCHYNEEEKAEKTAKAQKRSDAASYNTQLGMGYLKQGDRPRAKKKFLTALELAPSSPDVQDAMGYYFEKTGDLVSAKKHYRQALALAPDSGAQLNNYGTFLCRSGNYSDAETYFLKAVQDVNYVHTSGAYENAGLCAGAIPDYKKAETYFSKALEQDPRRKQSLYELASIELKQDKPDNALAYLQKYQELSLADPELLAMALLAAHKTGQSDIENDYKERLSKLNNFTGNSGVQNEYDSNNG